MTYFISKSHGHDHGDHGHGHGDHGHDDHGHGHHEEHHWLTECLLSKVWFWEYKSQVNLVSKNSLIDWYRISACLGWFEIDKKSGFRKIIKLKINK